MLNQPTPDGGMFKVHYLPTSNLQPLNWGFFLPVYFVCNEKPVPMTRPSNFGPCSACNEKPVPMRDP